jgi:hypothetical protein
MTMRRWALLGALLAVVFSGCSKTQDTTPENRIFGNPPVISSVEFASSNAGEDCDFTRAALGLLCEFDPSTPPGDWQFQQPEIHVNVGYTDVNIGVQATDPDSTATVNDILIVGASYIHSGDETTLLVFDDGSQFQFPFQQKSQFNLGCGPNDNAPGAAVCSPCPVGQFVLTSGDKTANDGSFFRGYTFFRVGGSARGNIAEDCIARDLHRVPVSGTNVEGQQVNFKIEVVDRSGNITTWPQEYASAVVQPSAFSCTGDECMCCIFQSDSPLIDCKGKPGSIGPSYPGGLCAAF